MPNLSAEQWRLYSDYLERAIELAESERAPWLAELASAHPEIAVKIEESLAARDRKEFGDFFAGPPFLDAPNMFATLIRARVAPYHKEPEMGRGGMGSVWRPRRVDGRFEGTVAIKFVHAY